MKNALKFTLFMNVVTLLVILSVHAVVVILKIPTNPKDFNWLEIYWQLPLLVTIICIFVIITVESAKKILP